MVWQLSVKHSEQDKAWNFIFATRKECIAQTKMLPADFSKKWRYKLRTDLTGKLDNERQLNNREYMIKKIPYWCDGEKHLTGGFYERN